MIGAHVSSAFDSLRAGVPTERIEAGAFAQAVTTILKAVRCRDSFAQGGVTMRDCSKNRAGFDRVLIAVAATFLAVSATSALAQTNAPRDKRRRTRDRCRDPAPRTGQRSAADRRRFQARCHRVGARPSKTVGHARLQPSDPKPAETIAAPAALDAGLKPPPRATPRPRHPQRLRPQPPPHLRQSR